MESAGLTSLKQISDSKGARICGDTMSSNITQILDDVDANKERSTKPCKVQLILPERNGSKTPSQVKHFVIDTQNVAPAKLPCGFPTSPKIPASTMKTDKIKNPWPGNLPRIEEVSEAQEVSPGNHHSTIQMDPNLSSKSVQRHSVPAKTHKPAEELNKNFVRSSKSIELADLTQWRNIGKTPVINLSNKLDNSNMMDHLHSKLNKVSSCEG